LNKRNPVAFEVTGFFISCAALLLSPGPGVLPSGFFWLQAKTCKRLDPHALIRGGALWRQQNKSRAGLRLHGLRSGLSSEDVV
jgi:hypothetical protein